jgi:hypothetical protein
VIAHIVLFKPRPDLTDTGKQSLLDAFTQAASRITTVKRCRIGRRVTHGLPGYESAMRDGFEYAAIVEFEDLNGLKAYLADPVHAAIGEHFTTAAEKALAYDYEMVDLADARSAEL